MLNITASRIRYEITNGNIGGAFAVKNMTGAIYVAGPLDYETRKRVSYYSYFSQHYLINQAELSATSSKIINLDNINYVS